MQQSISLHANSGGSDKIYNVFLVEEGDGYKVNYQNGRRGSTLTNGTKTATAVPFEKAKAIFDKLVKEKMTGSSKYKVVEGAAPPMAVAAASAKTSAGFDPMLLNAIDESTLAEYINDPAYVMQEKYDGERRPVILRDGQVLGVNKKGEVVPVLQPIADALCSQFSSVTLDAEQVGDRLYVFDILQADQDDYSKVDLDARIRVLNNLASIHNKDSSPVVYVATSLYTESKRALVERVRAENGEGVVIKRFDSLYRAGRPNSGGDWLKFKFTETLTAEVIAHSEGVRSVEIGVYDGDQLVSLKNVTVPASEPLPNVGSFCEVRYLYAYPNGGLAQPVFLKQRNDVDRTDAKVSQLKYKA